MNRHQSNHSQPLQRQGDFLGDSILDKDTEQENGGNGSDIAAESEQVKQLKGLQDAANNSPQVQSGKAIQRQVNQSLSKGQGPVQRQSLNPPAFDLEASEINDMEEEQNEAPVQTKNANFAGGGPVQRGKAEVRKLIQKPGKKKKDPFSKVREALALDDTKRGRKKLGWQKVIRKHLGKSYKDLDQVSKIALAKAWNENLTKNKLTVPRLKAKKPKLKDLTEKELEALVGKGGWAFTPPGLSRQDSQMMEKETWQGFLNKVKTGKRISVFNPSKNEYDTLEVLESASNAARLVRLFWHNHRSKDMLKPNLKGKALFAFRRGAEYGLFEDRGMCDVIYTPLRLQKVNKEESKSEKDSTGDMDWVRDGKIFNWSDMATSLSKVKPLNGTVKDDILKVLLQRGVPCHPKVMEAVGAMICDAKYSMTGFLSMINRFENSKETDPTKLFSSDPMDKPVWTPSGVGGRKSVLHEHEQILYHEKNDEDKSEYTGGKSSMDRSGSKSPPKSKASKTIAAKKTLSKLGLSEEKVVKSIKSKEKKVFKKLKKEKKVESVLPVSKSEIKDTHMKGTEYD